jgi:hypothetical protein
MANNPDIMKGLVAAAAMMAEGNANGMTDKSLNSDHAAANINLPTVTVAPPCLMTSPAPREMKAETKASESLSEDGDIDDLKKSVFAITSDKKISKDVFDGRVARERRLEQNRRAAVESRRRKKVMIAELQRSVTFYTKANESLKTANLDLEQRLLLARQNVLSKQRVLQALDASIILHDAAKQLKSSEPNQDDKHPPAASVTAVPFLPVPVPLAVSPVKIDQSPAHMSASSTLPDDRRLLQTAFSHLIGLPGAIPSTIFPVNAFNNPRGPSLDAKPSVSDAIASQLPSEEEVGGDKYLESLRTVRLRYLLLYWFCR